MTNKHTPGPWRIGNTKFGANQIWENSPNSPKYIGEACKHLPETKANATLIAAAPELLKSLKQIENWASHFANRLGDEVSSQGAFQQDAKAARAIITKAQEPKL